MTLPHAAGKTGELPVYHKNGLTVTHGSGMTVVDTSGRAYLDFYGGHATAALGHSPAGLVEAISAQASSLMFQTNAVDVPVRAEAAEALAALAPSGLNHVFFVNSGAEAVENALRCAFLATQRTHVVAIEGAFHGRTAAASAVTWGAQTSWYGFPSTPFAVTFVPPDDSAALEAAITSETAAFICEPVQGVAGARDLADDFLREGRRLCAERGALFIADEIQCGMGRSGRNFAVQHVGIEPDIMVTAKGLAGGFPAGALLASTEACRGLKRGSLGTTFGGGPVACAAIAFVCRSLADGALTRHVRAMSKALRNKCRVSCVEDIQGRGLLLGLRTRPPAAAVIASLREAGILVGGAADPHIVRLMPPLVVKSEHVDALALALKEMDG